MEAMLPYLRERFGNAASRSHELGRAAAEAVESAREQVAAVIGAEPREIVFTSGATESDNLAIKGIARAASNGRDHIVTTEFEHEAVLRTCERLEGEGFRVTYLPVNREGLVSLDHLRAAMDERTLLVSIMHVNNEVGTVQSLLNIGKICHERGVLFHTDAAQGFGKLPIDVRYMRIDLLSLTAHKIYGPKGVGALYVRRRGAPFDVVPEMDGGGQERGARSGTLNVPGIVALGEAARLCQEEMGLEDHRLTLLRERLLNGLKERLDGVRVNGPQMERLPGNLNVRFAGVESAALLREMPEIAVSTGSACLSGSMEPSYVLKALGLSDEEANSSVRFGLGRFTTEEEIDFAVERCAAAVRRLRAAGDVDELDEEPAAVEASV